MYHRVSQVSVEEINRVLRLIQDSPSLAYKDRGVSDTKADLGGISQTKTQAFLSLLSQRLLA